jgi:ABC-type multidrug transport system ATPase subunit
MQLTVEKLSKRYGRVVQALRDVDLTLGPGVLGLLGAKWSGEVHADADSGDCDAAFVG